MMAHTGIATTAPALPKDRIAQRHKMMHGMNTVDKGKFFFVSQKQKTCTKIDCRDHTEEIFLYPVCNSYVKLLASGHYDGVGFRCF